MDWKAILTSAVIFSITGIIFAIWKTAASGTITLVLLLFAVLSGLAAGFVGTYFGKEGLGFGMLNAMIGNAAGGLISGIIVGYFLTRSLAGAMYGLYMGISPSTMIISMAIFFIFVGVVAAPLAGGAGSFIGAKIRA